MKRVLGVYSLVAALVVPPVLAQERATAGSAPPRIQSGGFSNITFVRLSRSGRVAFDSGELDLYANVRLADAWSVLAEGFVSRAGRTEDVDVRPGRELELDLARLYVAYHPTDRFRLEIGQNHTGIIRWNEREHRGRFLQTPIDVPAVAQREEQGGAWPLRFVGLWSSGRLSGPLGIEYGAGVGSGRGTARDELQPLLDSESSLAQLFSLSVSPDALPGWQFGGSEYSGSIPAVEGALREVDQTLFTSYVAGGLEARGEWAQMHHTTFSDRQHHVTRGWYALFSWRPRGRWQTLRPYVLFDRLTVAKNEAYLSDVRDQHAWAGGLRWDATPHLAIKTDFRSQLARDRSRERLVRLQFAVSF